MARQFPRCGTILEKVWYNPRPLDVPKSGLVPCVKIVPGHAVWPLNRMTLGALSINDLAELLQCYLYR